jgi:hypothetical protein
VPLFAEQTLVFEEYERNLAVLFSPVYKITQFFWWIPRHRPPQQVGKESALFMKPITGSVAVNLREERHQVYNRANNPCIRTELGVFDPIQEFLENGMEDLYGRRDGDDFRSPFAVAYDRPVAYHCLRFGLPFGMFCGLGGPGWVRSRVASYCSVVTSEDSEECAVTGYKSDTYDGSLCATAILARCRLGPHPSEISRA